MSNPRPPDPSGRRRATIIGAVLALLALLGAAYGMGRADGATTELPLPLKSASTTWR